MGRLELPEVLAERGAFERSQHRGMILDRIYWYMRFGL